MTIRKPIISHRALEIISRDIAELETGPGLVRFLQECGVSRALIEYPNTKWRMVYSVLVTLAESAKLADRKVLFRIIEEASHPLMHRGDETQAKKYEEKFNKVIGYNGLTLKEHKVQRAISESKADDDLALYLEKKILLEKWRDDLPHPMKELSLNGNTLEQVCYALWDLLVFKIVSFGTNTFPEDLLIEAGPGFHEEEKFNWDLIRDLDNHPHGISDEYGIDIEILEEDKLKKRIDEEIREFTANTVDKKKMEGAMGICPDVKFLATPTYLRGNPSNYYAYKKQKEILMSLIADLHDKLGNEMLVLKFNEVADSHISTLRTILALEGEGLFDILELRNCKKQWADRDDVYVKVKLAKSKIPAIKKFLSERRKMGKDTKMAIEPQTAKQGSESVPTVRVEGLVEAIIAKNASETIIKSKKRIQLPHFPETPWKDVTIRFLDGQNVLIKGGKNGNKTATVDYEGLGFSNEKNKKPNLAWAFLLQMAKNGGETEQIQSPVPDNIKQLKKNISDWLKKLFKNDTEPFYDFAGRNNYKLKITLIPPQADNDMDQGKEGDLGVGEYLSETATSKYEEPREESDW